MTITTRKPKMPSDAPGAATSDVCPRRGFMRLQFEDHRITVPTTCKTWRCISCRDRVKMYVKMRMEHGILQQTGPCYLITVTYRFGQEQSLRHARSVRRDWAQLTKWFRITNPHLTWFQIPELTKNLQVHLHNIVGGVSTRVSCCVGRTRTLKCGHRWNKEWALAECPRNCLEHELAKLWFAITGDSFVVDARLVLGAAGAASYLTKYLVKGMYDRTVMENRGFSRRWSTSRNWPKPEQMQFAITMAGAWQNRQWFKYNTPLKDALQKEVTDTPFDPYSLKVGEPLAEMYEQKMKRASTKKLIRKLNEFHTENVGSTNNHNRNG